MCSSQMPWKASTMTAGEADGQAPCWVERSFDGVRRCRRPAAQHGCCAHGCLPAWPRPLQPPPPPGFRAGPPHDSAPRLFRVCTAPLLLTSLQLAVHLLLAPLEVLQVLHPFEEGAGDAAAVGVDVCSRWGGRGGDKGGGKEGRAQVLVEGAGRAPAAVQQGSTSSGRAVQLCSMAARRASTVAPPGNTVMPRWRRIWSASGVVGPLAASAMICMVEVVRVVSGRPQEWKRMRAQQPALTCRCQGRLLPRCLTAHPPCTAGLRRCPQ